MPINFSVAKIIETEKESIGLYMSWMDRCPLFHRVDWRRARDLYEIKTERNRWRDFGNPLALTFLCFLICACTKKSLVICLGQRELHAVMSDNSIIILTLCHAKPRPILVWLSFSSSSKYWIGCGNSPGQWPVLIFLFVTLRMIWWTTGCESVRCCFPFLAKYVCFKCWRNTRH